MVAQNQQKAVRIVSTGRLGRNPLWVSVEDEQTKSPESGTRTCISTVTQVQKYSALFLLESSANVYNITVCILSRAGDASVPRSCVTLMPYSLVTPHYPPVCRPVLLLPTILGRMLDKKLGGWQGFQLCKPGKRNVIVIY